MSSDRSDGRTAADGVATSEPGSGTGPAIAPATHGDRRIVTALFADLVDYVRMLAEHDPEAVRETVTTALATMAEAIERLDGTREKFIGDAVFAVFGWPRAHDDDALRASLAALQIRAGLAGVHGDASEPLDVRIGLATGEVVASAPRPTRDGDLGLTGEAITTAARIQTLARPGEILLDEATRRAARGRLATEDRGSVVLRGQSTPIELFALRGEAGLGAWSPHRLAAPGPLVGRGEELHRLERILEAAAASGRGAAAVVIGDPGIGKTRLLAAAEPIARRLGYHWTWTENVSYGRGEPYRYARLFAQTAADEQGVDSGAFARSLLFGADVEPEAARRFAGAIAAMARDAAFSGWEDEARHIPTDPSEVAAMLTEVAVRYIDQLLVTGGPRVVVVDDLHWLDPSSVGMVELLVAKTGEHPLVILAGTRPAALPTWITGPGVARIDLRGLDEPETAQLATLVARAALDAEGARSIHERTDGNPLFIRETVRAYLDDGTLEWRDGRVQLVHPPTATLPLTLRAVLGARIDALDPDAREILGVASVIGIRFSEKLVGDLLLEAPPADAFGRLAAAALIVPADGQWRFAHPLIHDTAYAGMLASRRRILHARLADYLEERVPAATVAQIAGHRAAAGDLPRALPLLREAAGSALALGATNEAAAFWRQAADLAAIADPESAAIDRARAAEAVEAARLLRETAGERT
jgi:class 3 adenylate cyclase